MMGEMVGSLEHQMAENMENGGPLGEILQSMESLDMNGGLEELMASMENMQGGLMGPEVLLHTHCLTSKNNTPVLPSTTNETRYGSWRRHCLGFIIYTVFGLL